MTDLSTDELPVPPHDLNAHVRGFQRWIRPERYLSLREWADEFRYLSSKSSAEPGKFRSSRTPYIREVMDALSNGSPYEVVVLMFGAQLGKTETLVSWMGYIADAAPAPTMIVQPSLDMAKRFSKQRLDPLFEDTPKLKGKLKPSRERDSGNSQLAKIFDGGMFIISGSNSPSSLRSAPIRYLALDEVDGYGITEEGSPIELAIARTKTFSRRKILITSTPTVEGSSNVEEFYLQGDQRKYHVPCPHCGEFQELVWESVTWENDDPETAHFTCKVNKCRILEREKTAMLEAGKWVPGAIAKNPKVVSFHLNSLYSPLGWFGLSDAVRMFLRTKGSQELLRSFVNTYLALPFVERGEAPDWERLYRQREDYTIGTVPRGAVFLTCGVDVQANRLEYEVVGWGKDRQSWSVEYGQILGDTSSTDAPVWGDLEKLLERTFEGEDGELFQIKLLAIDSGFNTQTVYGWCRKHPGTRVAAIKGSASAASIIGIPRPVDVTIGGKQIKRGLKLWTAGVSLVKSELYGLLRLEPPLREDDPYPAGYCHFPQYDEEYFKMLTAEQLMVRTVKGYRRFEWNKIRERNEALDLRVLNRVATAILGMDRWKQSAWDAMAPAKVEKPEPERDEATASPPVQTPAPRRAPAAPVPQQRRKSSYW
jgi:phage terminase large subunit GpA-like protein